MYLGDSSACSLEWVADAVAQIGAALQLSVWETAQVASSAAAASAKSNAVILAFQAGNLRGSAVMNEWINTVVGGLAGLPENAVALITDIVETVLAAHCPQDTSLAPKSDDGSSSMRASVEKKSILPVVALAAVAYMMLS